MEEKKITKAEFDAALVKTLEKVTEEATEKIGGMAAFIVPLTGSVFAKGMRNILFPETEGNEKC